MIIDTHCHLDDERFDEDFDEVLLRAKEAKIQKIIIPGADGKDLEKAACLAENYENIYFACGYHPNYAEDYNEEELEKFITKEKCLAVGECGLDYYRFDGKSAEEISAIKAKQKEVFIAQIKLAIKYNKPLIVHIREANEDSFNILKEYAAQLSGAVLHCYNASPLLLELRKYGKFYYGIGGVLTFKNAKKLVEMVKELSLDDILLETDGPYLSPEPKRGQRNEPAYTSFVLKKLAELLNVNEEALAKKTTENAYKLFNFKEKKWKDF